MRKILALILFFTSVFCHGQHLFPYRKADKWGFCDNTKKIVITPKYQSADGFSLCNIATVKLNNKYGFINKAGKEITEIKYTKWSFFWYRHTYVWLDNKVGVIDTMGKEIIPIIYDDVCFSEKVFCLKQNDLWSVFDFNGRKICEQSFKMVNPYSYQFIGVNLNDKWGFVDSTGEMKIGLKYEEIEGFTEQGLCGVKLNNKWGYINYKGEFIIQPVYDEINVFQKEGAWVKQNSKWGLINESGETVIPFEYDDVNYFKENLASVKKNGKYGFINKSGGTVIPFTYHLAFEFREGLAEVCFSNDSCGYINQEGNTIIPFQYSLNFGGEFNEGLAEIIVADKCGFIDKKGKTIIPPIYSSPYDYNSFNNGVGMLLIPNNDSSRDASKFYFDKHGTLFYED